MNGGILLLDKPLGLSSNAALQRVRRCFGGIKAGHAGSLDPLASGMLPICLGEATKVAGALLSERKCYEFEVTLGEARTTGDAEGAISATAPVPALSAALIEVALAGLRGAQQQTPPMYSALKHEGQPLYRLARQGQSIERTPRAIEVLTLELLEVSSPRLRCRVLCSKGTYVRVLGEELARALGSVGYLSALRRLYVDPFADEPMISLAAVEAAPAGAPLLAADRALAHLPAAHFSAQGRAMLEHGQRALPKAEPLKADGTLAAVGGALRLYGPGPRFLGLGRLEADGSAAPKRLWAPGDKEPDAAPGCSM